MDTLIKHFWEAGLIQFGRFDDMPFKLHFDLLPSYPDIWADVLDRFASLGDITHYERLLASSDSLPLGTLLSFRADVPLVYSRGSGREVVHDLAGAYDVGHPTLFVANLWRGKSDAHAQLIAKASKVGLVIDTAWVLMTYGDVAHEGLQIHSLFAFEDVVMQLHEAGKLPQGQVDAVMRWLAVHG